MIHRCHRLLAALFASLAFLTVSPAQGTEIGFTETWALAEDRAKVLEQLIPGTEEFYYYGCREQLARSDFAGTRRLLAQWIKRHGRTARVIEIENREALLSYRENPERTFRHLRSRLGLRFDHQRTVPGEKSDLPTSLDPEMLSPARLTKRAFDRHRGTVDGFEDRALAALLGTDLTNNQLRSLLQRLRRPDVPNLPALIVRDLGHKGSGGFGSLGIHGELRLAQLEECVRLRPAVLNDPEFVATYLRRLQPRTDLAWQRDPALRQAQLERLWRFAQRLAPAHNSLRAHVLYHWLAHDLTQGAVDKDRFMAFIQLPRRDNWVAPKYRERQRMQHNELVDYGRDYACGLPPVRSEQQLIRSCLEHFFRTEDSYAPYAEYLDENWLKIVLGETKLLLGQGDLETWYSMIDDPRRLEALEQRVELAFPATQKTQFGAGDPVSIELDVKNVKALLVKVFVIDSYRYHTERQREIDASIELDGLVANHERTYDYGDPALRRVRRSFDLPMLREPGTYVVEFVGNGISSRAVIHKGGLRHVERTIAAGHAFRIYDDRGQLQKDAILWFGGHEYAADDAGDILVPFSSKGGTKRAVMRVGNRSELITFEHWDEEFSLQNWAFVERESLIAGANARLVVRPRLVLNGMRIDLALLEQPKLTIVAVDIDGTQRTEEIRAPKLTNEREFVHELRVPDRLQNLTVTLRGRVKDLAGKERELSATAPPFPVNGIDGTAMTLAAVLVPHPNGYAIEVRGKNGEPIQDRACQVQLRHRDYRAPILASLQTDENGRIELGMLPGITELSAEPAGAQRAHFTLDADHVSLPAALQGRAGTTLRLPYFGTATTPRRAEFSLLANDADAFSHLAIQDGFLELRDLPAGDYTLHLHERGHEIPVRVTAGSQDAGWVIGQSRVLSASAAQPLHMRGLAVDGADVRIGLTNFGESTRVHVVATRYQPTFDPFARLRAHRHDHAAQQSVDPLLSSYHAGRRLGDEYRYVLERRFQTKFAGNMLERPSLLLNPWALEKDSWNSAIGLGGGAGGKFGGRGGRKRSSLDRVEGEAASGSAPGSGTFANLDFLPQGSKAHYNLTPDENGVVRVKLADLGDGHVVHVIALDGDEALYDSLVLQERELTPRSRALAEALPSERQFVERKRIEFVAAGGEAVVGDAHSADVEIFDSLTSVYGLLTTLSNDAHLQKFAFVLRWPQLDDASKRKLYSDHACHELHFFLYQKDRAFFDAIVKPFLQQKLHRTFLDEWLLGSDLRGFLEPWHFARLNLIEQILLAQRLDGAEREAVGRLVRERFELQPVDRGRIEALFATALAANELQEQRKDLGVFYKGPGDSVPEPSPEAAARPTGGLPGRSGPATAGPPPAAKQVSRRSRDRGLADEDAAADEKAGAATGSDDFFLGAAREMNKSADKELQRGAMLREQQRRLYRAVDPTKLLVESNYWRRTIAETTPDVVRPNGFWVDYATAPSGRPFVSPAFLETGGSFLEMMFALSVLDLPFEAGEHEVAVDGSRRTLRAATPLLLVRKEVTQATAAEDEAPLLLGQNLFRLDERYQHTNGEQRQKFVTDEFLTSIGYGAQVVVSNPTGQRRTIDLLLQIPAGALPLQSGFWTRSRPVDLAPYETKAIEYAFYFPAAGDFAHYPAHAAVQGRLVAAAEPRTLTVVETPSTIDTRSWEHVSQQGSANEVVAFLRNNNVQRLDLSRIAWRMQDRAVFGAVTELLRARHVYDAVIWSYGVLHRHPETTREFLAHREDLLRRCGSALNSPLVVIDPVERGWLQHLELSPLVHARAHRLGSSRRIGNADLARQYEALLDVLGYRQPLRSEDWLTVTYYMLLQDRIEDALMAHQKVVPAELSTQIQYDYLTAYLSFFTAETERARGLAENYRDHPVEHWRDRFREVLSHLDEAEGRTDPEQDPTTSDALAATAPAIELALEGRTARIAHKNVTSCEVRYYELDVEFAFSSQPFAATDGTTAAYVQPNLREERDLPADRDAIEFALPEQFSNKNVLIEVRAAGLVRSRTYFANALDVRFLESFGQVAVSDPEAGRPLPKTYVKVFARLPGGQVRFHKDGYTDLRGRFDYASLSDDPNAGANRYAVLVLSDERGAVIRDVAPPMQ